MIRRVAIACSLGLAVAAFYGCGNNSGGNASQPATAPVTGVAGTSPAAAAKLTVKVTDIRNGSGNLVFGVFTSASGFPSDNKKAVNWQIKPAEARDAGDDKSVTFTCELPAGTYGATVLHDENKNDKMDTRFGIPREGYGVTNNPKPKFRAAKFSESTFTLPPEGAEVTISIQYF